MSVTNNMMTDNCSNQTIIQWNINGVNDIRKKDELKVLCNTFHPLIICLQESHLLPTTDFIGFPTFAIHRYDYTEGKKSLWRRHDDGKQASLF